MSKRLVIMILLIGVLWASAPGASCAQSGWQSPTHGFILWGEAGVSMLMTSAPQDVKPLPGPLAGLGLGYELFYRGFVFQTGLQLRYRQAGFRLPDGEFVLEDVTDSERWVFDYHYSQTSRRDRYSAAQLQLPLLFGGEWSGVSLMVGAKVNLSLYGRATAKGVYSTAGDYEPFIDWFEDMPNHQFFTDYMAASEEQYIFRPEVQLSAEIGYTWHFDGRSIYESDHKLRLSLMVDYGLLDSHKQGEGALVTLPESFQADDMQSPIQVHHLLGTAVASSKVQPLSIGIKLTYILNPKHRRYRCMLCERPEE